MKRWLLQLFLPSPFIVTVAAGAGFASTGSTSIRIALVIAAGVVILAEVIGHHGTVRTADRAAASAHAASASLDAERLAKFVKGEIEGLRALFVSQHGTLLAHHSGETDAILEQLDKAGQALRDHMTSTAEHVVEVLDPGQDTVQPNDIETPVIANDTVGRYH